MNLRIFLILQVLMLCVVLVVSPMLTGADDTIGTIILDFAVFYLSAMFVGYLIDTAPLANALAVNYVFNFVYYGILFFSGWTYVLTFKGVIVDFFAMTAFSLLGGWVGMRSRPVSSDQDVAG